jgi:thymidylate kinase
MSSPNLVIVTGIHCAGKTTIANRLEDLGYQVAREIPQKLVVNNDFQFATEDNQSFQEKIFELERERDRRLVDNNESSVVISWHIASLAHSREKASDELVIEQETYLREFINEVDPSLHGIHLSINEETLIQRSQESKIFEKEGVERTDTIRESDEFIGYYDTIENNMFSIYDEFGIDYTVIDNDGSLHDTIRKVERIVRDYISR